MVSNEAIVNKLRELQSRFGPGEVNPTIADSFDQQIRNGLSQDVALRVSGADAVLDRYGSASAQPESVSANPVLAALSPERALAIGGLVGLAGGGALGVAIGRMTGSGRPRKSSGAKSRKRKGSKKRGRATESGSGITGSVKQYRRRGGGKVLYAKNGTPYVIGRDGRPRFIKGRRKK